MTIPGKKNHRTSVVARMPELVETSSGGALDLARFGVRADGRADDTASIQKALDAMGKAGGTVLLPAAKYLVAGSLTIPPGVSLEGVYDAHMGREVMLGAVILATGGRGSEDGPALFEMGHGCMVRALTVFYPEQDAADIHPYPWTFHLQGCDNAVENTMFVNSYNAIRIGPEFNVRHRIRSVVGCALRRGIFVDNTLDIGRIENVQIHVHFWKTDEKKNKALMEYIENNLEAFIFGRSDWEYVTNTFVFPAKTGYRFIKTPNGLCMGQFCGIGADWANRCVSVEDTWGPGLLITNGEFVACLGDEKVEAVIEKTCTGSVRFENCSFFGNNKMGKPVDKKAVVSHSQGFVSLSNCYFDIFVEKPEDARGKVIVEADGGKLQVRGCSFQSPEPSVVLRKGLKHAIVCENNGVNGVEIVNEIGDDAIIANNEPYRKPV